MAVITASAGSAGAAADQVRGLGDRPATPEEQAFIDASYKRVTRVAPNDLSRERARREGRDGPPSLVDNSLSVHFPPVRSQSWQGNCTGFAACYYYNTFTQARDEGLNAASGDNDVICSPAFIYPLVNGGGDNGANTQYVVSRISDIGCCSWNMKPYEVGDATSWPTEAAWVEALRRRTSTPVVVGALDGCTDADLLAIKQHLANGNLAVTRADAYDNWYSNYPGSNQGISNSVLYANVGGLVGGHAMALVGYDDSRWYFDGATTRTGAFLVVNSWGPNWGVTNTGGVNKGFMWVGYDYFKGTYGCFGVAYFNDDRPRYRPRLYAASGMNHSQRGSLFYRGGVGHSPSIAFRAPYALYYSGGTGLAMDDTKRVVTDLTDGIPQITDFADIRLHCEMTATSYAVSTGTMTSADFFYDFDGDTGFSKVSSPDPPLSVAPNSTRYANVTFSANPLSVAPSSDYATTGTQGGPFPTPARNYSAWNTGAASADWQATATVAWLSLGATGGTLAAGTTATVAVWVNSAANSLPGGRHTGAVIFTNLTSGQAETRTVTLDVIPVAALTFQPVKSPQGTGRPFPVTIAAVDSGGTTVTAFDGSTTLSGFVGGTVSVGNGPNYQIYPMRTLKRDVRTQCLFLRSELGSAGWIRSVAIEIVSPPPIPLNQWTIRMQHSSRITYNGDSTGWTGPGWTTVYQVTTETVTTSGWKTYNLTTPYYYDGVNSLMVDFSFSNPGVAATNGYVRYTNYGTYYAYTNGVDGTNGSPLTWTGWAPTSMASTFRPNVRFLKVSPIAITPTMAGPYASGVWTGMVTVPQPVTGAFLYADDGMNHSGQSNMFDVADPPVVQMVGAGITDGAYRAGQTVPVTVRFSRPVTVAGAPSLQLETGTVDRAVAVGSATTDTLTFPYVIQPGDTSADLDYVSTAALAAAGGEIVDALTGVEADPTLSAPGSAGSLAGSRNLVVDTDAPLATTAVDHSTRAGTTAAVTFTSSDTLSGLTGTRLFARRHGQPSYWDTGLAPQTGTEGTFAFAPPADGRYELAAVSEDAAGNTRTLPTVPDAVLWFNDAPGSAFSEILETGAGTLVFPMTDDHDVTITVTGAAAGSTVTVARSTPFSAPGYFRNPDKLVQESLDITGAGLGTGWNATLEWCFDPARATGVGEPVNRVYRHTGGAVPAQVFVVNPTDNVVTVPGVTGFSTWYLGAESALPVRLSGFEVE